MIPKKIVIPKDVIVDVIYYAYDLNGNFSNGIYSHGKKSIYFDITVSNGVNGSRVETSIRQDNEYYVVITTDKHCVCFYVSKNDCIILK